jgi:hypothetical protein
MAGLAAVSTLWAGSFHWPVGWRVALTAVLVFTTAQIVQTPPSTARLTLPRGVLRGLVFAAAIIAPSGWYAQGGLVLELARKENALFVLVAIFAAILAQSRKAGEPANERDSFIRAWLPMIALVLITAVAVVSAVLAQHPPPRAIFAAVALTALILAVSLLIERRSPIRSRWLREFALLAPWLILPVAVWLID